MGMEASLSNAVILSESERPRHAGCCEETMPKRTHFKDLDCIIAWDAGAGVHAYLWGGDLVLAGDRVEFVGRGYRGTADEVVAGKGLMAMPGLVDIHSHPST